MEPGDLLGEYMLIKMEIGLCIQRIYPTCNVEIIAIFVKRFFNLLLWMFMSVVVCY